VKQFLEYPAPMKSPILIVLLSVIAVGHALAATDIPYLPNDWSMVSADRETKARTFESQDRRAKLVSWQNPVSGDRRADLDRLAYRGREKITYQRRGRNWLAVSGYRGDQIFYRKSNVACGGTRWHNIEFTYPISDKRRMDRTVTTMARAMTHYANDC
jgi:hypothetical protein